MILERLGKELYFLTVGWEPCFRQGLLPGELPETWNLTHAEAVRQIHRSYFEAGSDIVLTNTFGANALKFHDESCSLKEIIFSAVSHVKEAAKQG